MTLRLRAICILTLLNSAFCTSLAHAITNNYDGNWFLAAGGGLSLYHVSDDDNFITACEGLPPDHYYKNSVHDGSFLDVSAGYAFTRLDDMFPGFMLGIRYTYAFNGEVTGFVNQYDLAGFKNYAYDYDFSRQTLMGIFKANIFNGQGLMPFFIVGGGASFNRASEYKEYPRHGVTRRVSPGYDTRTNTSWAYIVGVGIDYAICDDIWASLEYNFGDFGTVETGDGTDTNTVSGMNFAGQHLSNKVRANSIFLNFTYLINYV